MNHKHNHCGHELKHCEKCDTVYCTKCSKEWTTTYNIGTIFGGTGTITYDVGNTKLCHS